MTALSVDLHFHPEARRHFLQLGCYLADFQLSIDRTSARQKLTLLTSPQFRELCVDVCDEIARREAHVAGNAHLLPPPVKMHPQRVQARRKMVALPTVRFKSLCSDVHFELERRFPFLRENDVTQPNSPTYSEGTLASPVGLAL